MKHADWLMDRIFMLDGLPNLQDLGKLQVGEDVPEILACDLRSEQGAQATIKEGMAHCESVRDYVSRDLLQKILDDTEEHIDFLETQIDLIEKVGLPNYLQSQMGMLTEAVATLRGARPAAVPSNGPAGPFFSSAPGGPLTLHPHRSVATLRQRKQNFTNKIRMLLNNCRIPR